MVHLLGTLYLCAVVVRDALMPERDVVRRDGTDDPGGGVLDRAPDVFTLGGRRASHAKPVPFEEAQVSWGAAPR
jgi:hypothetical protein